MQNLRPMVSVRLISNRVFLVVIFSVLLCGCSSRSKGIKPSIEFTRIPPAELSSTDELDIIQGRAIGARPGQQIVLYARTGSWWLQPLQNGHFTDIQQHSSSINS